MSESMFLEISAKLQSGYYQSFTQTEDKANDLVPVFSRYDCSMQKLARDAVS